MFRHSLQRAIFFYKKSTQKMHKFPIEEYEVGDRIDRYLKNSPIGWISGQKYLRKKDIFICKEDGTSTNASDYRIQSGDTLMIAQFLRDRFGKKEPIDDSRAIPKEQAQRILKKMILFDNENVTIINKANGFSVQGGLNPKTNLFSIMCSRYKKQLIYITHRLDKPTSGLVIFAKNRPTAQLIQMSMEDRVSFSKFYLAETEGRGEINKEGYIRCNVEWTGKNKARLCSETAEKSKDCVTFFVPITKRKVEEDNKQEKYYHLFGIKLLTGRKHQIRCHLSGYLQQQILNDVKYGGSKIYELEEEENIHLHAFALIIKKRQLIDKILAGPSHVFNQNVGNMKIQQNSVIFTAKVPEKWDLKQNKNINLLKLAQNLEQMQKDSQKDKPNRRNITMII